MSDTTYKPRGRPPSKFGPKPRITLTLEPEAAKKLRRLSYSQGVPMSQIVSKLVLEMPE